MSIDPNVSEHFTPQTPLPARGGSKVWLFVGLGCGVVLVLCCGVGVGFVFLAGNAMQIVQDPEAAARTAIGQVAPEIEAEDLDGQPFKLSDYRGKVVMLDFWGHW